MTVPHHSLRSALDRWRPVLLAAALVMTAGALYRVPRESWFLVTEPLGRGVAHDLVSRYVEVQAWFAGAPVYGTIESADYPPASYPVLWPLVGWSMSLDSARILWAVTTVITLVWLAWALPRAAGAGGGLERWFIAAIPLAANATAANIRVGQATVQLIAVMLASIMLLARPVRSPRDSVAAALLMLLALTKPTFTAPLVWLLLFRGGAAAAATVFGGYLALTLIGASFQRPSLVELVHGWLGQSEFVDYGSAHANLHSWLGRAGLDAWLLPASLGVLAIAGIWTWLHRDRDIWIVAGVLAFVARFWSYHRWYDDLLVLLPLVALFREARRRDEGDPVGHACVLLVLGIAALGIAPAWLHDWPAPWGDMYKAAKSVTWLVSFGVLLWLARRPHVDGATTTTLERSHAPAA